MTLSDAGPAEVGSSRRAKMPWAGVVLLSLLPLVLIMEITEPGVQRSRAMSFFVAALGSGAAIGLVLGGVLTPPHARLALGHVRQCPARPGRAGRRASDGSRLPRTAARLDLAGAVSSTAAMAALVYA